MKPSAVDKLGLWLSTSRTIDGLWVGSFARDWENERGENEREITLRRVEDALHLIKLYDPLSYSRVTRDLKRIWVNLVPHADACYERSLQACLFDERYVLSETATPERLAQIIVHEATHARLERCGIDYDEKLRQRIEAVCHRRELAFVSKLPNGADSRHELARALEWSTENPDYYSNYRFEERWVEGRVGELRYFGVPEWIIRVILRTRRAVISLRNILRRRFARID